MAIELPARPGIRNASPGLLDWGGRLVPILGGPVQNIQRLGTRLSLEFELPPVRNEPYGREWAGKLLQAKLEGAIAPWVQDGFNPAGAGSIVVDGADQTGMTLAVTGGTRGYAIAYGQFFSLVHDGRRYLHMVTEAVRLDADGAAELAILPMLRVIPDDGDTLEFSAVKIQGSLVGDERRWKVTDEPYIDFGPLRIDEDE